MSVLETLKARSRTQHAMPIDTSPIEGASAAPVAVSAAASRRGATVESYCTYWIARLEAIRRQPPEAMEAALRAAIQHAPARQRPSVEDARLFLLVGRMLSAQDLIDWLRIRARFNRQDETDEGTLSAAVARYWLDRLDDEAVSDAHWASCCQQIAQDAVRVGQGLEPRLVDALVALPAAACGYLRAAGTKGQFQEADARAANLSRVAASSVPAAESEPSTAIGSDGVARPDQSLPPPAQAESVAPNTLPLPTSARTAPSSLSGGGVGLRLGGWVGGVLGGVATGMKAGFTHALRAIPAESTAQANAAPVAGLPFSIDGFRQRRAKKTRRMDERQARSAAEEAESALTAFCEATHSLGRHPQLTAFWEAVDHEATTRFQGQRADVFQEMCTRSDHPLQQQFEQIRNREPEIALQFERSQAAFRKLEAVWTACAGSPKTVMHWAPSSAQLERLRTACRWVPPDGERPPLSERAEQMIKTLVAIVRQTFVRAASSTERTAPSP